MKKFIVIGNKNALTWKETFPFYMSGKCRYGYTRPNQMILPTNSKKFNKIEGINKIVNMQGTTKWITTFPVYIDNNDRIKPIYISNFEYVDGTDIVNTDSIYEIPENYDGLIAAPIDILSYLPEGYEVIGKLKTGNEPYDWGKPVVGGVCKYVRILIRRKSSEK